MKKKPFLMKVVKLLLPFLWLFLFCMIYLLPSIKGINHLKRNIKAKTIALNDFSKIQQRFLLPKQRELSCFDETDRQLRRIISEIKSQSGVAALRSGQADHLNALAVKWKIRNSVICFQDNGKLKSLNPEPMSELNKQLLHFCQNNSHDGVSTDSLNIFRLGGGPISLLGRGPTLQSMLLLFAFRADLRTGSMVVLNLNQSHMLGHMATLKIQGAEDLLVWLVGFKLYYFDMTSVQDRFSGENNEDFPLFDLDAEILLGDISSYVKKMDGGDVLPEQFGGRIFDSHPQNPTKNLTKNRMKNKE